MHDTAHFVCHIYIVRDENDGLSPIVELLQNIHDLIRRGAVECGGRLVCKNMVKKYDVPTTLATNVNNISRYIYGFSAIFFSVFFR